MHKVFISYHHANDQYCKEYLLHLNEQHHIFVDRSVDTGDISDDLDDQKARRIIRDKYLRDSTVTILLVGTETKHRKHIDWELYSSMIDGEINKKSGILVVNLPTSNNGSCVVSHGRLEKEKVYTDVSNWVSIDSREEYKRLYPNMPERIIDNLQSPRARVSVVPWRTAIDPDKLGFLINAAHVDRSGCMYDLNRPMRRHNRNPRNELEVCSS